MALRGRRLVAAAKSIYSPPVGPYREATATETMEVSTGDGLLRLEVAPRHTTVRLGDHIRLSATEHFATFSGFSRRRRTKKRSFELRDDVRLLVARSIPTRDVGLWYQPGPDVAIRLFGCRPLDLFHDEGLKALRRLDQLAEKLADALGPHAHGVATAMEIGNGADRVLITDYGDRLVFYIRRLFREWPRRALEAHADGTILLCSKSRFGAGEQQFRCSSRYGVTSIGDHVRFADHTGQDLGSVAIPWVNPEERRQIAELIGQRIDQHGASS
ncbi:MAG: hypothetical protein MJE77_05955 [Proteobacteria bacterium]|nr:hypothetical protein [Pseudomonadota bacterium]